MGMDGKMEDVWERVSLYTLRPGTPRRMGKMKRCFYFSSDNVLIPFRRLTIPLFPFLTLLQLQTSPLTPAPPIAIVRRLTHFLEVTFILAETPLETCRLGSVELFFSRLRLGCGDLRWGTGFFYRLQRGDGTECRPDNSLFLFNPFVPTASKLLSQYDFQR